LNGSFQQSIRKDMMAIISNGKRFAQIKYAIEKDFEEEVVAQSKILFGKSTIYINAKKKIDSKSLGAVVPDGFFLTLRTQPTRSFML
jgi:hypothetical protein